MLGSKSLVTKDARCQMNQLCHHSSMMPGLYLMIISLLYTPIYLHFARILHRTTPCHRVSDLVLSSLTLEQKYKPDSSLLLQTLLHLAKWLLARVRIRGEKRGKTDDLASKKRKRKQQKNCHLAGIIATHMTMGNNPYRANPTSTHPQTTLMNPLPQTQTDQREG